MNNLNNLNNNYVNDSGSIATIVSERNGFKAYVEPDSNIVGPYTSRERLVNELINSGFYEAENA